MAERLPGIFRYNWSVWCQENHPPSGTVCRRKGWVADVNKCHSVPYKMVKALELLAVGHRQSAPSRLVQGVPSQHSGHH